MSRIFGFRVDPDNLYAEDRKVQPVKTYIMSPEELAKYKTEPYKKPAVFDLKQNKDEGENKMETVENIVEVKEKVALAEEIRLTDTLIKQEIDNGLTADDMAIKYNRKAFWIRGRISRMEQDVRKEQPIESEQISHKYDIGKPRLDLVPPGIIEAVGIIRTYGSAKHGDPDGWKKVERERYDAAMMRHLVGYLRDKDGVDEESKLPHLWHMACNIAFLIEFKEMETKKQVTKEQEGQA